MSLMHTTAFAQFPGTLPNVPASDRYLWRNTTNHVQGRFFHCALTGLFEPVWQLAADGALTSMGHEALMRTWTRDGDLGLSPWKVFSLASGDSTLVESGCLCRLVHTLDYFPCTDTRRLVISVHGRLLAAVATGHGKAFHCAVTVLGLHSEQSVIQMSSTASDDLGLLLFVVDNYRRDGSAMAVQASDPVEVGALLVHIRPAYLKLDARYDWRIRNVVSLTDPTCELDVTLVLRCCERPSDLELAHVAGVTYVQGNILPGAKSEPKPAPTSQVVPMAQAPLVQQWQSATGLSLTQ